MKVLKHIATKFVLTGYSNLFKIIYKTILKSSILQSIFTQFTKEKRVRVGKRLSKQFS